MATFNTETLKKLVAYSIQGAGLNEKVELSMDMGISVLNNTLYLNTMDGTNYLSVSADCTAEDFDIVVDAETFAKLIGKINSDVVELNVNDKALIIKGNGKYTLELLTDNMGELLSFPDVFPEKAEQLAVINAGDLVTVNSAIKASLSNVVDSVYSSYYFGDMIASTDRYMLSVLEHKVFDTPYLLNKQFVDLMCMTNADVEISKSEDMIVAETSVGGQVMII